MFNEKVMGKVVLKEKKLLRLDFLTTIPIPLKDVDDKPLANEKSEAKEVVAPMVNTWKS
jgi:GTPase